jgi:hypothetical protein
MIIQYYSDSLGLSRPGHVKLNQRYIYLFISWLKNQNLNEDVFCIDRAKGGATLNQLYDMFNHDEEYIIEKKEILIIHEGVCDCAPRPIPLSFRNLISKLPAYFRIKIISYLHNNRAYLLKKGFMYYLTPLNEYEQLLKKWLENIELKFNRIYIFNIAPTNIEIEKHSPGFSNSIIKYNSVIEKVIKELNSKNIVLIDIYKVILESEHSIDEIIIKEDGHHLTALAHQIYADKLIEIEKQIMHKDV